MTLNTNLNNNLKIGQGNLNYSLQVVVGLDYTPAAVVACLIVDNHIHRL